MNELAPHDAGDNTPLWQKIVSWPVSAYSLVATGVTSVLERIRDRPRERDE